MMMNQKILVWEGMHFNTTEFVMIAANEQYSVNGYITGEAEGVPLQVSYRLEVSDDWNIQSVFIEVRTRNSFSICLHKNDAGRWLNEKSELLPQYNGCMDIDISLTPFTNTLPINRLQLAEGAAEAMDVVYIDVLRKKCKRVRQRYACLGKRVYRYENLLSGFAAIIETDADGYVIDYPGIWQRISP